MHPECFWAWFHAPAFTLYISVLSCVFHFWVLQIQRVESNLRNYLTQSLISVQPPRDIQKEMTHNSFRQWRERKALRKSWIICHKQRQTITEEPFWDTKISFRAPKQQFKNMVPFWIKLFHLSARVPSLEPGGKL